MARQLSLYTLFAFLLTLLVSGCNQAPSTPIKIGINAWPGYEFLYLAQEKGFYDELGVSVKIVEYGSLGDVRRGYERGNLDVMASTLIEVLQVKNNSNRKPMIFMVADFSDGGDVIVARNTIKSVPDLKGKRVGADTASLPIFMLARALDKHGLTLDDVEVVPLEQPEMEQAYDTNKIDAAVSYAPVSSRLASREDAGIIFTSKEIPGEVVDVVSVEETVLKERLEDVKKITMAWDKALKYMQTNPDDAKKIMAKREGISVQEFSDVLGDLYIVPIDEQAKYFPLLKPSLKTVKDVLVRTGVLAKDTSADCCVAENMGYTN